MKNLILLLILMAMTTFAFAQTDKQIHTVSINDIRKHGTNHYDTSTAGRKLNEVSVDRTLYSKPKTADAKGDLTESYQIHFFKMYEGKLRNYQLGFDTKENYDQASYQWQNDTIVAVTLVNSSTKQSSKTLKLVQTFCKGCSAGIMEESLEYKE